MALWLGLCGGARGVRVAALGTWPVQTGGPAVRVHTRIRVPAQLSHVSCVLQLRAWCE